MKFAKNLVVTAALVVAGMIVVAVVCFTTGVGVNVPWLVTAPPRGGAAPSIDVAFDPLGLVAVTLLGAALFTAVGALRTRVARA